MALVISSVSIIALIIGICFVSLSHSADVFDTYPFDDGASNSDDFGEEITAPDSPNCPCVPRDSCPRIYGQSATDVRELGFLEPCMEYGTVRCCGVSVSRDEGAAEPVTGLEQTEHESSRFLGENSAGMDEMDVGESKVSSTRPVVPIRSLLNNRRQQAGPQLTFPSNAPLEPPHSEGDTKLDGESAIEHNTTALTDQPNEASGEIAKPLENEENNEDGGPVRSGARILTGNARNANNNRYGIRRPALAPWKGPSPTRERATTIKPIALLRPSASSDAAAKKKLSPVNNSTKNLNLPKSSPVNNSTKNLNLPKPSQAPTKEVNKTVPSVSRPVLHARQNVSFSTPKIRPFRRLAPSSSLPSSAESTENAQSLPPTIVTSVPFTVLPSNRQPFNHQRPRQQSSPFLNRRNPAQSVEPSKEPVMPVGVISKEDQVAESISTADGIATPAVASTVRPLRRRRPTSSPPVTTTEMNQPEKILTPTEPTTAEIESSSSSAKPKLFHQPEMTGHRKLLRPRGRPTAAPLIPITASAAEDELNNSPFMDDHDVASTKTVEVTQEAPANMILSEAEFPAETDREKYMERQQQQEYSPYDYSETNPNSFTIFTESPVTTTATPPHHHRPNRMKILPNQIHYPKPQTISGSRTAGAAATIVTSVPVRTISQYSRIRTTTDEQGGTTTTTEILENKAASHAERLSHGSISTSSSPTGYSGSRRFSIPSHLFQRIKENSNDSPPTDENPQRTPLDDKERHSNMQTVVRNRVRDPQRSQGGDNYDLVLDKEKRKYMRIVPSSSSSSPQASNSDENNSRYHHESLSSANIPSSEPSNPPEIQTQTSDEENYHPVEQTPYFSFDKVIEELPQYSMIEESESRIHSSVVEGNKFNPSVQSTLENGSNQGLNLGSVSPVTVISSTMEESTSARPYVRKRIRQRTRIPTTTTSTTTTTTESPTTVQTTEESSPPVNYYEDSQRIVPETEEQPPPPPPYTHYSIQYDEIEPSLPTGNSNEFKPITLPQTQQSFVPSPPESHQIHSQIQFKTVTQNSENLEPPPAVVPPPQPALTIATPPANIFVFPPFKHQQQPSIVVEEKPVVDESPPVSVVISSPPSLSPSVPLRQSSQDQQHQQQQQQQVNQQIEANPAPSWTGAVESSIKERLRESSAYHNNQAAAGATATRGEYDRSRPSRPSSIYPSDSKVLHSRPMTTAAGVGTTTRNKEIVPNKRYENAYNRTPLASKVHQQQQQQQQQQTSQGSLSPVKIQQNERPSPPLPISATPIMRSPTTPVLKTTVNIRTPENHTPPSTSSISSGHLPTSSLPSASLTYPPKNITNSRFRVPQKFSFPQANRPIPTATGNKNSEYSASPASSNNNNNGRIQETRKNVYRPESGSPVVQSASTSAAAQPTLPRPTGNRIKLDGTANNYYSRQPQTEVYRPSAAAAPQSESYYKPGGDNQHSYNNKPIISPNNYLPPSQAQLHGNVNRNRVLLTGDSKSPILLSSPPAPQPPPRTEIKISEPQQQQQQLPETRRPPQYASQETISQPMPSHSTFSRPINPGQTPGFVKSSPPPTPLNHYGSPQGQAAVTPNVTFPVQLPASHRTIEEVPKQNLPGSASSSSSTPSSTGPSSSSTQQGTPGFSISFTSLPDRSIINHGPVPPNHYMTVSEKPKILHGGQQMSELVAVPKLVPAEATAPPSQQQQPPAALSPPTIQQQQQIPSVQQYAPLASTGQPQSVFTQPQRFPLHGKPHQNNEHANNYYRPNGLNLPPVRRPPTNLVAPLTTSKPPTLPYPKRPSQPNELYGDTLQLHQQRLPYQYQSMATTTTTTTAPSFTQNMVNRLKSTFRISRSSDFSSLDEPEQNLTPANERSNYAEQKEMMEEQIPTEQQQQQDDAKALMTAGDEIKVEDQSADVDSKLEKRQLGISQPSTYGPPHNPEGSYSPPGKKYSKKQSKGAFKEPRVMEKGFFPLLPYSEPDPGPKLVKLPAPYLIAN